MALLAEIFKNQYLREIVDSFHLRNLPRLETTSRTIYSILWPCRGYFIRLPPTSEPWGLSLGYKREFRRDRTEEPAAQEEKQRASIDAKGEEEKTADARSKPRTKRW